MSAVAIGGSIWADRPRLVHCVNAHGQPQDQRSLSACLRNASGTEREISNTTDLYPIAPDPKRWRMASTARSAAQRTIPLLLSSARLIRKPKWKLELQLRALLILRSPGARWSSHTDAARAPCAPVPRRSPARIAVVEIGASRFMQRLTECRSAK
jgi:hypothetical protein